jgi:hypothetical protein
MPALFNSDHEDEAQNRQSGKQYPASFDFPLKIPLA